jgi:hypothetical protein
MSALPPKADRFVPKADISGAMSSNRLRAADLRAPDMWPSAVLLSSEMEDDMSVDLWTKIALTVIAVSLAVIAWKLPFADVGHAQIGACGVSSSAPCHVATNGEALKVQITNAQDFH